MTREIALHCMKSYSELHSDLCELCPIYGETGSDHCFEDALQYVIGMLEQEPILDTIRAKIDKIYEREGSSFDCLNALDELKEFIDRYKTEDEGFENKLKDLSERVENIEKQMKDDKEEQLKNLKAKLDYAKFRCTL